MDLGATRLQTLRLVVLPALWPAMLAAGAARVRAVVRRLRALVLHDRRVAAAAAGAHLVGDPLRRDADDQRDRDADARDLDDRDRARGRRCRGCSGGARAGSASYWGGRRHERGGPLRGRDQAVRLGDRGRRPQPDDRAAASSSRCSARRAAARRRRCGWSRASSSRPRARSSSTASRWRTCRRSSATSTRCSRATRCSSTSTSRATSRSASSGARSRRTEIRTRVAEALELVQLTGRETATPERALRRPAPARRARARARQPARGAAARRAARRARPEAAQGDAGRAQGDPARGRDHVPLRHARPGGGARDVRPDRGHERRRRRAVRDARGGLRAARPRRSWPASSASRT